MTPSLSMASEYPLILFFSHGDVLVGLSSFTCWAVQPSHHSLCPWLKDVSMSDGHCCCLWLGGFVPIISLAWNSVVFCQDFVIITMITLLVCFFVVIDCLYNEICIFVYIDKPGNVSQIWYFLKCNYKVLVWQHCIWTVIFFTAI